MTRSALVAVTVSFVGVASAAYGQNAPASQSRATSTAQEVEWILPYTATPNYLELVALTGIGRSNSKTELFAGPQIRAFAFVPLSVDPGERLALLAEMTLLVGDDLWPVGADIGDITELRFIGADSALRGFSLG